MSSAMAWYCWIISTDCRNCLSDSFGDFATGREVESILWFGHEKPEGVNELKVEEHVAQGQLGWLMSGSSV